MNIMKINFNIEWIIRNAAKLLPGIRLQKTRVSEEQLERERESEEWSKLEDGQPFAVKLGKCIGRS